MRRLIGLVLATLVAVLLLVPAASATAAEPGPAADDTVLAAAAEPTGPQPMDRTREDNPARELAGYEDREVQFTWGAAWLLLFLGLAGLVVMLGVYRWLVVKPAQQAPRR